MAREQKEPDPNHAHSYGEDRVIVQNSRRTLVIGLCITIALVVGVLVTWLFDVIGASFQGTPTGQAVFVTITATVHGLGQYLLLSIFRKTTKRVREKVTVYNSIFWGLVAIEFVLVGLFLLIILQVLLSAQYDTLWVIAATAISMSTAVAILALQSYTFFSWLRIHTRNIVIAIYALAPGFAAAGVGFGIFRSYLRLTEGPDFIAQQDPISFQLTSSYGDYQVLFYLSVLLLLISYMFFWFGSVMHLRSYSKRKNKFKYWLLAFVPAIIFPTTLAISIGAESAASGEDSGIAQSVLTYRLVAITSAVASFVMNGCVYFVISKNLSSAEYGRTRSIRYSIILAGFGTMTLGLSIAVPTFSTYPPFEAVPRSFMGFAAFLYSIGLYSSAISLAEDINLRQLVRKLAFQSGLLDGIGNAQMQKELQKQVLTIVKEHSEVVQKSGIESSVEEEDVKQYLEEIMNELSTRKGKQQDSDG